MARHRTRRSHVADGEGLMAGHPDLDEGRLVETPVAGRLKLRELMRLAHERLGERAVELMTREELEVALFGSRASGGAPAERPTSPSEVHRVDVPPLPSPPVGTPPVGTPPVVRQPVDPCPVVTRDFFVLKR